MQPREGRTVGTWRARARPVPFRLRAGAARCLHFPGSDSRGGGRSTAGRRGLVAQRAPDLADAEVQGLFEVDEGAVGPDLALDLLARQQAAGLAGQQRQHAEGLELHFDARARLPQLRAVEVQLERAKAEPAERYLPRRAKVGFSAHRSSLSDPALGVAFDVPFAFTDAHRIASAKSLLVSDLWRLSFPSSGTQALPIRAVGSGAPGLRCYEVLRGPSDTDRALKWRRRDAG